MQVCNYLFLMHIMFNNEIFLTFKKNGRFINNRLVTLAVSASQSLSLTDKDTKK